MNGKYGVLWADLDHDRLVGGSRPNQNDYVLPARRIAYLVRSLLQQRVRPSVTRWYCV